jgi:hypothetical protein
LVAVTGRPIAGAAELSRVTCEKVEYVVSSDGP